MTRTFGRLAGPSWSWLTARRRRIEIGVVLLLAFLAILRSAWGTRLDAVTVDEPWHIVAGAEYWQTGDFRLNPEHPPLTKLWVGAFLPSSFSLRPKAAIAEKSAERDLVEETFFYDNDFRAAQRRARLAMWSFHFLLLAAIGLLLCRPFGLAFTAGALAFAALEPTFGAHAPVVMTDLPLAFTLTIAALCAGRLAAGWSWRWAAATGLAMGLALGAKHSALPGLAGLALFVTGAALLGGGGRPGRTDWRVAARRAAQVAVVGLLALGFLWALYFFHFHAGADGSDGFNRPMPDKIADLQIPRWRNLIAFADAERLLPRSYLWGLADTVRAGVEGRGQNFHFLWGTMVKGETPWYTWPSYLASKVPLPLLVLAVLGVLALVRERPKGAAGAGLLAMGAAAAAHLLALSLSQGSYAGVRHALPLVMGLALLAGAAVRYAWRRSRPWRWTVAILFVATAAMTAGENRLWEYHNETVGGTAEAWRWFRNEGNDLGQRALELARFDRETMAATGEKVYSDYWFAEEEARALGMNFARRVAGLEDDNQAGIYEGYFVYNVDCRLPWPDFEWDPAKELAGLERVARFGAVEVWHGRQVSPQSRAYALRHQLIDYIYGNQGEDWALVARRLTEVLAVQPHDFSMAIELGNAYLRLGQRGPALEAYRQPFSQRRGLLDALTRHSLEERIAELERGEPLERLRPLRNPWME